MAMLQVKIRQGVVEGLPGWNQSFSVFRGIPYAKPQTGSLRWAPPQPAEPGEGIRECFKWGDTAMQGGRMPAPGAAAEGMDKDRPRPAPNPAGNVFAPLNLNPRRMNCSEDGLNLNVWTPAESPDEKLPVCVWIHGGGFGGGTGSGNAFDGEAFCKKGMVMVSINYRLGVFGFLSHPELTAENNGQGGGNWALMDMQLALRWVKENIAAFGGDPDHVGIFGQSAGGMAVRDLACSPLSAGLFDYAIIQSGGGTVYDFSNTPGEAMLTLQEAEQLGLEFFEFAGYGSLEEARKADAFEVRDKANAFNAYKKSGMLFKPNVDGIVLPESAGECAVNGHQLPIHYMIGCAHGDGMFGDPLAAVHEFAEETAKHGPYPPYVYYLSYVPPGAPDAHHSMEHHYVFKTLDRGFREYSGFDYDMAKVINGWWADFFKTGDPNGSVDAVGSDALNGGSDGTRSDAANGGKAAKWLPYTTEEPQYMDIGNERVMKHF